MLELADHELTLSYLPDEHQIRIDFNLDIDAVATTSSFDLDLSDLGLSQLDGLVDFSTSGAIDISAGAVLALSLGLDLDELGSLDFDDAVVVYPTTGIIADASIHANDLTFSTSFLSLPVEVGPGRVELDSDGIDFAGGNDTFTFVPISITPRDVWPEGYRSLADVSAAAFRFD